MTKDKTILICDDDEGILDMLEIVLEGTGYHTVAVQNSLYIFDQIEKVQPDLILLDLWMPVLSGDQVLKNLRNNVDTLNLPVIIISASSDGKKIANDSGANDFIAKPFDVDLLIEKVESYLN